MVSFLLGGEALSRAEPPAGPLKFDLSFADVTFPKISPILGIMPEPMLQYNFFKNAYTDTGPTFLDRYAPGLGGKIA